MFTSIFHSMPATKQDTLSTSAKGGGRYVQPLLFPGSMALLFPPNATFLFHQPPI
jgi:hypothetical protein